MNWGTVIAERESKTIYKDGDTVIKVFSDHYARSRVLNEALNQARVEEETKINVPKIREVTKILGRWAIISDYIEGQTLSQLMKEKPKNFDEYLKMFVGLQQFVHQQRSPLLSSMRDKLRLRISQSELDATTKFDLILRLDDMPHSDVVCHGDFHPSNIIVRGDGELFVLDWSHAVQGHAAADIAESYMLLQLSHGDEVADRYLNMTCKKNGMHSSDIKHWMPIAAAALARRRRSDSKVLLRHVDYSLFKDEEE